jgi:signal recognition particle receptor subunit beta
VLVGNKFDSERVVSKSKIDEFVKANSLQYFECSVKENYNVDQTVLCLLRLIYEK